MESLNVIKLYELIYNVFMKAYSCNICWYMGIKNHVTAIDWQRYKFLFYIQKVCHLASCFVSSWYIIRYYLQCLPVQSYRRSSTTKQKWSVVNFAVYTIFYWSPNTRSTKMHEYYISQGMLGCKQLVRNPFEKED